MLSRKQGRNRVKNIVFCISSLFLAIFLVINLASNWITGRYLRLFLGMNAFWFPIFFIWLGFMIWKRKRPWLGYFGFLLVVLGWGPILDIMRPNIYIKGVAFSGGGETGHILNRFLLLHLKNPASVWLVNMFVALSGLILLIKTITSHLEEDKITYVKRPLAPKKKIDKETIPSGEVNWHLPPLSIFRLPERKSGRSDLSHQTATAQLLEGKLRDFGVEGRIVQVNPGPVVNMYEFEPASGVKISQIVSLADDLARVLKVGSIRVVAPISGKSVVGIEVPNKRREVVHLREVLEAEVFNHHEARLLMGLGKDIFGKPAVADLQQMPHLLIAGATGTGKSVCLNSIICSFLTRCTPDELRLLIIDPKRIELSYYNDIPHLLYPVITEMELANKALKWAVKEMERRYELLSRAGARNIDAYNKKISKWKTLEKNEDFPPLTYLVILVDELADLMIMASKEVETSLVRLAQMSRAAGIHLVLATQRPSVDILTGIIKVNFPARISFQVSSKVDSRTILDTIGAERLLGMGDMLFLPPGTAKLQRLHGAYVSEEEVNKVVNFWKSQGSPNYLDDFVIETQGKEMEIDAYDDEKYMEAVRLVIKTGKASISMVQRHLRIGYNRAARLIERMEQQGVVSPSDGIKPRKVLIKDIKEI